jgi:hypothetical protein
MSPAVLTIERNVAIVAALLSLAVFPMAQAAGLYDGIYSGGKRHVIVNPNPTYGKTCKITSSEGQPGWPMVVVNDKATVDYDSIPDNIPRHYYGPVNPDGSFNLKNYDLTNTQIVDGGRQITGRIVGNRVEDYEIHMGPSDVCQLFMFDIPSQKPSFLRGESRVAEFSPSLSCEGAATAPSRSLDSCCASLWANSPRSYRGGLAIGMTGLPAGQSLVQADA